MKHERWRQVEELFHAALERGPEERQAFLVQACGEDTELRLQVEHLISIDQRVGSRLETPVNEEVFATLDADAPLEGAQVGPYRILSLLGAGGMGKVYRAHDTSRTACKGRCWNPLKRKRSTAGHQMDVISDLV